MMANSDYDNNDNDDDDNDYKNVNKNIINNNIHYLKIYIYKKSHAPCVQFPHSKLTVNTRTDKIIFRGCFAPKMYFYSRLWYGIGYASGEPDRRVKVKIH